MTSHQSAFYALADPSSPLEPGESGRIAIEQFPGVVNASNLSLWRPGDPIVSTGFRVLIGAGSYCPVSMSSLDSLTARMQGKNFPGSGIRIDVFDLSSTTEAELPQYFEGPPVLCSPIIGIWRDGQPIAVFLGRPAWRVVETLIDTGCVDERLAEGGMRKIPAVRLTPDGSTTHPKIVS